MPYALGIDLGTTYSAAAVSDASGTTVLQLGAHNAAISSVAFLRDDGVLLVGDAAERRGISEPERMARDFKRRFGDPTPILLGGTPYGAESLMAHLLRSIIDLAEAERGERAARVVVTHPASYGPYKLELMTQVVRLAGLTAADLLAEPEAAAIHYAGTERVAPGEFIAVYDLGGGTFDAAVVRKSEGGFELVGDPEGLERFGGIDIDHAVFAHVAGVVGDAITALPAGDQTGRAALAQLRESCRRAKEALSTDTDAVVPVMLPACHTEVRINRVELEAMIRPRLAETVDVLERAIHSADLTVDDISRVLLVGGCSRIPLVAESIRTSTKRPIALDANPKHAIALGAAAFGLLAVMSEIPVAPIAIDRTASRPQRIVERAASAPAASSGPARLRPSVAWMRIAPERLRLPLAVRSALRSSAGRLTTTITATALIALIAVAGVTVAGNQLFNAVGVISSPPPSVIALATSTETPGHAPTATPPTDTPSVPGASLSALPIPLVSTTPAPTATCIANAITATTGVEGVVLWGSTPVAGLAVEVTDHDGNRRGAATTTRADGAYRIVGLPANSQLVLSVPSQSDYASSSYEFVSCGGVIMRQDVYARKRITLARIPTTPSPGPVRVSWRPLSVTDMHCVFLFQDSRPMVLDGDECSGLRFSVAVAGSSYMTPFLEPGREYVFWVFSIREGRVVGSANATIRVSSN